MSVIKSNKVVFVLLLLLSSLLFSSFSSLNVMASSAPVLTDTQKVLYIGYETYTIAIRNKSTSADITYHSADEKIATVSSNGIVTPVSPGSTTITITIMQYENSYSLKLFVLVRNPSIKLSDHQTSIELGTTYQIQARVTGIHNPKPIWSSDNSLIASVDKNGVVTANNIGSTKIRSTVNGSSVFCTVTVTPQSELGLAMTAYQAYLGRYLSKTENAHYFIVANLDESPIPELIVSPSPTSLKVKEDWLVFSYVNGAVTEKKADPTSLLSISSHHFIKVGYQTIKKMCSPNVFLDMDSLLLESPDSQYSVSQTIHLCNAKDTVSYLSLDPLIATVDASGTISPLSSGKATIAAIYMENIYYCDVIVADRLPSTYIIQEISKDSIILAKGYYDAKLDTAIYLGSARQYKLGTTLSEPLSDWQKGTYYMLVCDDTVYQLIQTDAPSPK